MAEIPIRPVLHPATRILGVVAFALLVQRFSLNQLAIVSLTLPLLSARALPQWLRMLRRARWLLLSLLLIYGWATPGTAAFDFALSPTGEGLQAGALQAWRLALMLAALALLLAHSDRDELLAGLYCLLRPLRGLGLSPERVAARLWLTLHYAEMPAPGGTLAQRLQAAFAAPAAATEQVVIELPTPTWRDGAVAALLLVGAAALLL